MEASNHRIEVPNEIWCHIIRYVCNYNAIVACKRVSRLFYNESKTKRALPNIPDICWDEKATSRFLNRVPHTYLTKDIKTLSPSVQRPADGPETTLIKAIILGCTNAKRSLVPTIANESFYHQLSLGVHFVNKAISTSRGSVKLQIFDTFFHENYARTSKLYFRGTKIVLLCFEINDRSTFVYLMEQTLAQCSTHCESLDDTLFYLIGLYGDDLSRQTSLKEVNIIADELRMKYFEIPYKEYPRIKEMLQEIGEDVFMTYKNMADVQVAVQQADASRNVLLETILSAVSSVASKIVSLFR